ncbi:GIY-YIG nuclease family protein [Clostridium sp. DJ247]|uniref:GIY-YIG nuclease family protein n=1 Tax=Clostridium sp. DJ247 TaxID=2726188 RepID=UPI0016252F3D|nr:GIY-YIG nuclease family protein [Clostridium sp. DJ247]MBC2578792.1 GIY-YIG nuclease family protein [Clostridium sp. DJ247]
MDLKEKIKKLPSCPGVYLMKDSLNSVIYVGKSKNLKNRVGSYFQNSKSHSPKVLKLVKNLKDFEYILTDTEFEAFMLECKLIKGIKPIYNKQMKSPKSYSYINVKINEKYPDIEISNEPSKGDGKLCFGPYTNRNTVERGLHGIKECCKILCSSNSRKASCCLNYSLGLCIGMCLDSTPREQYFSIFDEIIKLLNGTDKSILEEMEYNMNSAAEKFDFENAAKFRDYISAVNYLLDKVKVVEFIEENKNIALLEYLDDHNVKFFLIKGNKVLFSEKYELKSFDLEKLKAIFKTNILFYFNDKGGNSLIEIGREEIDESQIIYTYLKSKSSNCKHVIISEKWLNDLNNVNIDNTLNELI